MDLASLLEEPHTVSDFTGETILSGSGEPKTYVDNSAREIIAEEYSIENIGDIRGEFSGRGPTLGDFNREVEEKNFTTKNGWPLFSEMYDSGYGACAEVCVASAVVFEENGGKPHMVHGTTRPKDSYQSSHHAFLILEGENDEYMLLDPSKGVSGRINDLENDLSIKYEGDQNRIYKFSR